MNAFYVLVAFGAMLLLMVVGMPIAVSMAAVGVIGGVLAYGHPFFDAIAPVVWGVHNDNLLTSIPLFVLMGELLLRSGIADKMFGALAAWLGSMPGGLLHTGVGCSALFAATSGSSVATAATIGTVALPSLHSRGYSTRISLGSIAAGGTLGILIPPSVNLIIYGSLTNTSIGKLFMAGIVPGILLTGSFMLFVFFYSIKNSTMPKEAKLPRAVRVRLLKDLLSPAIIFGIVMGSLYGGIATTTESAALGVVAAIVLVWRAGQLDWGLLQHCFVHTAKTSGMILLIITSAFILNLAISLTGVAESMTAWVTSFGFSATQMLIVLVIFYLVLGMFMDVLSMMVATIPITFPIVSHLGADPVWFGIFIVLMCELGMITPPVGMNLFVVQGIRKDGGPIADVMLGAIPFVLIMLLFTAFLIAFPQIATWLPNKM